MHYEQHYCKNLQCQSLGEKQNHKSEKLLGVGGEDKYWGPLYHGGAAAESCAKAWRSWVTGGILVNDWKKAIWSGDIKTQVCEVDSSVLLCITGVGCGLQTCAVDYKCEKGITCVYWGLQVCVVGYWREQRITGIYCRLQMCAMNYRCVLWITGACYELQMCAVG